MILEPSAGVAAAGGEDVTFADVAPILRERCVMCHQGPSAPLGLRLDSLDGVLVGSQRGPVVTAGDPPGSELILRLKGESQPRMPMTGPPFLSDQQIDLFERWVAGGLSAGTAEAVAAPPRVPASGPASGEPVTYAHVAPIFATRCAKCHTEQGQMGPAPEGLRLTSYAQTLSADDRVRVVPGRPEASELVRRIRGQARPRMPFDGPPYLTEEEIRLIEDWVAQGARASDGTPAAVQTGSRVRLHGTLSDLWALDGLPLEVTGHTRIRKSPGPGDYVRVRGRLTADGGVVADRIRRR
jgi:mono/diheme cytochrome c family protein